MSDAFDPAIAALETDLREMETKAREIKGAINLLSKRAGRVEPYPNIERESSSGGVAQIRADSFYGKTISTAAVMTVPAAGAQARRDGRSASRRAPRRRPFPRTTRSALRRRSPSAGSS